MDTARASSLPNIPVTPKRVKLKSVPRLPDDRMTRSQLKAVMESELENKRSVGVKGLIEHNFTNHVIPFNIDSSLEKALKKTWDLRPKFLKNKAEAALDAAGLKAAGDKSITNEHLLGTFFNRFGKEMVAHALSQGKSSVTKKYRQWSGAYSTVPLPGDNNVRKPDLILTEHTERTKTIETWAGVRCVCEHTTEDGFPSRVTDCLLARAVIIFRQQPSRRFVWGLIISEYEFSITLFDRSGVWESPRYIIGNNLLLFYRTLAGLMFSPLACLGYDPNVHYKNNIPSYIKIGTNQYMVLDVVFVAHGVVCQGTICYVVFKDGVYYVIKEFWADPNRAFDERDYLKHLADANVENVSTFVEGGPVSIRSPYDARSIEIDETDSFRPGSFKPKTPTSGPYHDRVHYRLVLRPIGRPITTFRTKEELVRAFIDVIAAHKRAYEAGVLHRDLSVYNILLQELVFVPIKKKRAKVTDDQEKTNNTTQTTPDLSLEATLNSNADENSAAVNPVSTRSIGKRSISTRQSSNANASTSTPKGPASNVEPEERRKGLLIDFGYACFTEHYMNEKLLSDPNFLDKILKDDAHRSRTGTLPFMSIGVLSGYDPVTGMAGYSHDFNDDLESIFYILVWICVHYEGPGKPRKIISADSTKGKEKAGIKDPTAAWYVKGTYAEVAMSKSGSMDHFAFWLDNSLPPYFKDMHGTLIRLFATLWPSGKESQKPGQSRFVKNHATYEGFLGALSMGLLKEIQEPTTAAATAAAATSYNSFLTNRFQEIKLNNVTSGYTSLGAKISSDSKVAASKKKGSQN